VKPGYWDQYPMGYISGQIFNVYLDGYLGTRNATWPYYEMFNIVPTSSGAKPYISSRECFDFVLGSLRYMNSIGASFNGKRSHWRMRLSPRHHRLCTS
jgi:hypothetical protein